MARRLVQYDDLPHTSDGLAAAAAGGGAAAGAGAQDSQPPKKKARRPVTVTHHWDDPAAAAAGAAAAAATNVEQHAPLTHEHVWGPEAIVRAWTAARAEFVQYHAPQPQPQPQSSHRDQASCPLWPRSNTHTNSSLKIHSNTI